VTECHWVSGYWSFAGAKNIWQVWNPSYENPKDLNPQKHSFENPKSQTNIHTIYLSLSLYFWKVRVLKWSLHNPQWLKISALFKITRQAMYIQCNIQAPSLNHFCSSKAIKYYIFWVCVCSLIYPAYNACATYHIVTCGLFGSAIFFHISHKRHDFWEKVIEQKMFWFSVELLSETFLILGWIQRDTIEMYIGLHVKHPLFLSDFNKNWIFLKDFKKITKYQILRKSV
jgi:hypothetical protein